MSDGGQMALIGSGGDSGKLKSQPMTKQHAVMW